MVKYLCKKEASTYLTKELGITISDKTLSKYITEGGGPEYFKFGWRVVYTIETLNDWVSNKISGPKKGSFEDINTSKNKVVPINPGEKQ